MIRRNIIDNILTSLGDTPVVFINGARQTGKSTLVKYIAEEKHPASYLTFDEASVLAGAKESPQDFIDSLPIPVVIDEVQRVPEIFLAIKRRVDSDRMPGSFILTGSANVLLLPKVSESLAGRVEIITLWPFSQGELLGKQEKFVDLLFHSDFKIQPPASYPSMDIFESAIKGGYPEITIRKDISRKSAWFDAYITTILQRDVRDMSNIEGLTELPKLLSILAARSGSLLNFADLSRNVKIPQTTLKRYLTLLQTTFLAQPVPAYFININKRFTKAPKIFLNDSGLLSYLLDIHPYRFEKERHLVGALVENFVVMELIKQITWNEIRPKIYHYRLQTGQEVDVVLEDRRGNLVGIEIKSAKSVNRKFFKGLRHLQETFSKKFLRGIVLYTGDKLIPFGKNLFAVPIEFLWRH